MAAAAAAAATTTNSVIVMEEGTLCTAWNYNGDRMAAGSLGGTLSIFDAPSFSCSSRTKVVRDDSSAGGVVRVVWVPPEYGDAVACILSDGSFSIWEEHHHHHHHQQQQLKLCKCFDPESSSRHVLDIQFGLSPASLRLVAAYSDGCVKVYELLDPLHLNNWQLQAEFQNAVDSISTSGKASCLSASVSWNPHKSVSQGLSFVLGLNSDAPQLNTPKVWEFDEAHQRWIAVAELALPEDAADPVYAVAWAPNIGRPYEVIAAATNKGVAIWHIGVSPDLDGSLSVERIALLTGHKGEVWQMEWDMSGMTLATTGSDGTVRLWQSNLNGIWQEQATLEPRS